MYMFSLKSKITMSMHVVNYDILKLCCTPLRKRSGTFLHQEDVHLKISLPCFFNIENQILKDSLPL